MMLENLKDKTIILGSQSPRRKQLLAGLGIGLRMKRLRVFNDVGKFKR